MAKALVLIALAALITSACGGSSEAPAMPPPSTSGLAASTAAAATTDATGTDAAAQTVVAVARPSDDVAHPASRTEWWYAHAMDPATGRTIIVTLFQAPLPVLGGFWYTPRAMKRWTGLSLPAAHAGPGTALQDGSISFVEATQTWQVRAQTGGYTISFNLTSASPGITAGPLRFGTDAMHWTVPVATSTANGFVITPEGRRVEIRNWRGYHDHNWGPFSLESDQYRGWEWAVVHEPDGHAALLGGVTANDGPFTGVLARISPKATTFCRTGATLSRWTTLAGFRFPQRVAAACDDLSATFNVTRPLVAGLTTHALTESVATTVPGSLGLVEHLARKDS